MRKDIKEHFDNYLYLTKNERNGLIVLMILAICFLSAPYAYDAFRKKEQTDFSKFLKEIESHQQKEKNAYAASSKTKPSPAIVANLDAALFYFDPNSASKEDFLKLGLKEKTAQTIVNYRQKGGYFFQPNDMKKLYTLSPQDFERIKDHIRIKGKKGSKKKHHIIAKREKSKAYEAIPIKHSMFDPNTASEKVLLENGIPRKQVSNIINYRNKGGIFYKKENLKKIYGMPEHVYENLLPYIDIPVKDKFIAKANVDKTELKKNGTKKTFAPIQIDINNATTEEWQKLRGIGPAFSKRIVKFRDALGGFYSVDQVGETFGLPDSTFQSIKPQLVESSILQKININQATEEELKKHPYIKWKHAKLIIAYREMHGEFKKIDDLLEIKAFDEKWLEKVKGYLLTM